MGACEAVSHVSLAGLSRRDSGHRRSDRGRRCLHRCLRLGRLRLDLSRAQAPASLRCLRHSRCRCRGLGGGLRGRLDGLGSRDLRRGSNHGGGWSAIHRRVGESRGYSPGKRGQ